MSDIVSIKSGEVSAKNSIKEGRYPFFTSSKNNPEKINKYSYDTNAILITITGHFLSFLYRGKFEASDCCFLISPKIQGQIYFLLEAINLIIFELHKNCPGVKVLKEFEFKPTSIIIPNKELLEKFNSICEAIQLKIESLSRGIEKLERMKKDLHKMIFSQKIEII